MDGGLDARSRARLQFEPPAPGPVPALQAAGQPCLRQSALILAVVAGVSLCGFVAPKATGSALHIILSATFWAAVTWRLALLLSTPSGGNGATASGSNLPQYSIVVALYREAAVAEQLVRALDRIDYPRDRLEAVILLEEDDDETGPALAAVGLAHWMRVIRAPPGRPQTKPRALNVALAHARGEFLVVYDAEDVPDPLQLREAAARFAAEDDGLVCLQAPLRIRRTTDRFCERQFAAEYAALFEIALPAMARFGLPFPLGGTSNHFRVSALRAIGGWDPTNVTEDADLAFRMAQWGWRTGVLSRATSESAPQRIRDWLPQRTRWLKGYLQTWLVHTRGRSRLPLRGALTLHATLGTALLSAAVQAWVLATLTAQGLLAAADGRWPAYRLSDLVLLGAGWTVAALSCRLGSNRTGRRYAVGDALLAPLYWAQLSLAFVHAVWQLVTRPTHWDKTDHQPDLPIETAPAGRLAA